MRSRKRDIADLQQFRGCEKNHVSRIVVQRIHKATLVDVDCRKTRLPRFNRAGQSGWAGTHDYHITRLTHALQTTRVDRRQVTPTMSVLLGKVLMSQIVPHSGDSMFYIGESKTPWRHEL
jgi:hypothetical protein